MQVLSGFLHHQRHPSATKMKGEVRAGGRVYCLQQTDISLQQTSQSAADKIVSDADRILTGH